MSPGKRTVTMEGRGIGLMNQMENFKLQTGLLNVSILQAGALNSQGRFINAGNYPLRAPHHHHHQLECYRRTIRPRVTCTRWNMMISSRYKTELCRQFDEEGCCHFDDKCLFAHGRGELRPIPRHPKYKTELCRDFHETGFCSFGPRCNFIHSGAEEVVGLPAHRQSYFSSSSLAQLGFAAARNTSHNFRSLPSSDTDTSELSDAPFVDFFGIGASGLFGAIGETKFGIREDSDSDDQLLPDTHPMISI